MSYRYVQPGLTTVCDDTPRNWHEFHAAKDKLNGVREPKNPSARKQWWQRFNQKISGENARIRGLRRHLPGHEPDHF
jgi:hypothetical protein